jgi:isopentenyl diphosphate isomerase/L-lactate dehydrogenase-like FMN-dependent dehydrogenase
MTHRRAFLQFLAGSPLLAGAGWIPDVLAQTPTPTERAFARATASAAEALDVFDMQTVASRTIPPAHWGYMMSGVDGETTLRANEQAYAEYQLRVRRFVDVSRIDLGVELFGTKYNSPIVISPVGGQRSFHVDGELAVARAAKTRGQLQILSTSTSTGVEQVIEARGAPVWFQLYTTTRPDITVKLVKRAEAAGCPVVAVTVDRAAGRNMETATRFLRIDNRVCTSCHGPTGSDRGGRPMFDGIDMEEGTDMTSPSLTWDFVKRLKDMTKMKVLIKGLETREDAVLALKHGADGIIVSNHGGRAQDTGRGTLEALVEIVPAVRGRVPVIVDGGVRRGSDVLKALALGANAVGIGRPYIWGLGAFGEAGVDRVLAILNAELRIAMGGVGARTLKEITPVAIMRRK